MDPNQILLTLYAHTLAALVVASKTNNTHKTPVELARQAKDFSRAGAAELVELLELAAPPPPPVAAAPARRTVRDIPPATCLNCGGPKNQPSVGHTAEIQTGCRLTHYGPYGTAVDPNAPAAA